MERSKNFDLITQMSLDINEVKDLDLLLERILTHVRKFFNADAGSIYFKEGDDLKFSYTQNETLQKRLEPGKKLIYNTFSLPINNDSIAGYVAKNCKALNIPDVRKMTGSEPYHYDSNFDEISDYRTVSMLTVPMTNQRGDVLGVMQMINTKDDKEEIVPFSKEDESLISHFAITATLAVERARTTRNIILRMISMTELRDPGETAAHVNRVASYSVVLFEPWARIRNYPLEEIERQMDLLRMAAMLHDVGKVAISDLILKKPGKLSFEEFEIIKSHTYIGARLFKDPQSDFEDAAVEVALNHHEKWNGTGYPGHIDPATERPLPGFNGPEGRPSPKKGLEIPVFGRIVAVADVYDALLSRRCYKEAWDEDRVLTTIEKDAGMHFDPEIVDILFSRLDDLRSIAQRYPDKDPEAQCDQD